MRRRALAMLLALSCAVPLAADSSSPAAAAEPTSGSCREDGTGPTCLYWYGRITGINDGDGVDVDLDGGDNTSVVLRMNGLQATELTQYSNVGNRQGDCFGVEAANRLEQLVPVGTRVRLSAQYAASNSGGRPRRSVFFQDAGGVWRDVARPMLWEGHALWLPAGDEPAHNAEYSYLSQQARERRVGIWRTDNYCGQQRGTGHSENVVPRVWANWDASGTDGGANMNGEFIVVKNPTGAQLPIGGWYVRDSAYRGTLAHGYQFPSGATIAPYSTVTVHAGSGTNSATRFFWGQSSSVFENVTVSTGLGDGAYLFDPSGDLRASMVYACRVSCANPLRGKIAISAMYDPAGTDTAANEFVRIKNISTARIDLEGYQLWSWPYGHVFTPNSRIYPGETMRVYVGKGSSTRLRKYWGLSAAVLGNGGDSVAIRSLTNVVAACRTWGTTRSCRVTD